LSEPSKISWAFRSNVLPLFQEPRASARIFAALKLYVTKIPLNLINIVLAEHLTLVFAYLQTYSICFAQLLQITSCEVVAPHLSLPQLNPMGAISLTFYPSARRPWSSLACARAEEGGRPKLSAEREAAVRAALKAGTGIRRTARLVGTGNATVARIAAELRTG
jgi:hypothetical protein